MQVYTFSGLGQFAASYGTSTYGDCVYSSSTTCGTAAISGSGNGTLVNTGIAVGLIVGIACLVLVLVILVRFWRRPPKPVMEQEQGDTTPDDK
ncbi:MAG TPA: hypothetical protein VLH38_04040 [Patescibacteria group bacterium]|nr:hypothetical protein [Patescibacteria group bacterium]